LFADPYRYCNEERAKKEIFTPEHRALARKAAAKSFVLLKNESQTLPLKKQGTVAVIGPLANTGANMPGTWSVSADHANTQTLVDGMKEVLGKQVNITSHLGANLSDDAALQERSTM